jgi:3-oxocholest-4-en-26-oate---CoA ligase
VTPRPATFSSAWETIADAIGECDAIVQGDRRVSWSRYEERAARFAQVCLDAGLSDASKVGLYLYNSPEYAEAHFGALKFRGVPVNLNYRYLDEELRYLLEDADIEALVFHRSLGDRVVNAVTRMDRVPMLIEVIDGAGKPGAGVVPGALNYEQLLHAVAPAARMAPQPDQTYITYTGGTTGMPKGVVYPLPEFTAFLVQNYPAMIGMDVLTIDQLPDHARRLADEGSRVVAMSAPPLMHGTGCSLGLMAPHLLGGTAVLLEGRSLDPVEIFDTIEREHVQQLIIVGDAFAKPLLRVLTAEPDRWDTSSLRRVISSGVIFSVESKRAMLEMLPDIVIADVLGSSEGGMGYSIVDAHTQNLSTARFMANPSTRVFTDDWHDVEPGSGESGMVASSGLVPLGYYGKPDESARTFREIDGMRWAFTGDRASIDADGNLVLLGRGSSCINTGGEKVFPEEVEEALKLSPVVEDALVFGVDDDRFGQRVAGVISLRAGLEETPTTTDEVLAFARSRLSGYKLPRRLVIVDRVPRTPSGKADYPSARAMAD